MKMLNSIGPSIEQQCTPLLTCLQLDFVLLITAPCAHSFGQFSIHLTFHLPNLYFISLPTKVKVNNMDCSPVFHTASHLTVEGNELGQVQFPLYKSMLTTLITFLSFMCLEMLSRRIFSITFPRI